MVDSPTDRAAPPGGEGRSLGFPRRGAVERSLAHLPRYRDLGTELMDTTDLTPREVAGRIAE